MWQVCSGFAHGRPWATLAMNEMQRESDVADGKLADRAGRGVDQITDARHGLNPSDRQRHSLHELPPLRQRSVRR
jgi:hypothetical protein